jgi:hypothetical protein
MAYKVFSNGDALTGSELNTYLMNQSVMVFASTTARNAALPAPVEGMLVWLQDTDKYTYYNGSAWTDLAVPYNTNAIINGAFDIWQRGTSFVNPASFAYTADRWKIAYDGTGSAKTISQQTFTPGTAPVTGYENQFFLRWDHTTAGSSATYNDLYQPVEDVRSFAGQTVTFSFWAKASSAITVTSSIAQNFGTGGSAQVATAGSSHVLSTSWTRYSVSIAVPAITGKTVGTGSYISPVIRMPLNATFTFDVSNVQLEAGSIATAFKRNANSLQGELAACQRYLPVINTYNGELASGLCYSTTKALIPITFQVAPRVPPTGITVNSAGNFTIRSSTAAQLTVTALTFSTGTYQGSTIEATVASGLTAGNATNLFNGGSGLILFTGCEL